MTTTFAEAEVTLAAVLPGYEARPEQQALASFIETGIESADGHLLAEAGCGTGKSMAYLIPSIGSGKKTVISTATKALQDQLAKKDLPWLQVNLGVDFTWALLKGRSNYVCRAAMADPETKIPERETLVRIISNTTDFDGQRANLDAEVTDQTWREMTVNSDECPGKTKCPFGETCFAEEAKKAAQHADVVVVNHAIYLLDLKLRAVTDGWASMLPNHEVVVFDEAHELEDWATSAFTDRLTAGGLIQTGNELVHLARRLDLGVEREAQDRAAQIRVAVEALWERLEIGRIRPGDAYELKDEIVAVVEAIGGAGEWLKNLPTGADRDDLKVRSRRRRVEKKLVETTNSVIRLVTEGFDTHIRWVETYTTYRSNEERLAINNAPIDVSTVLRPLLWNQEEGPTAILASATLSFDGSFGYVADRLGIDEYASLDAGTPFDYATQATLYIPEDMTEPTPAKKAIWEAELPLRIEQLVQASGGRALILFTSVKDMKRVYEQIAHKLPWTTLMQGQKPNAVLAEEFSTEETSVLFATKSFFTGVDVQGMSLGLVIISKMPFPVPTDAIVEARSEAIDSVGGNSFGEFTMPYMGLILKQAFGRLIRHRNDRGLVAILDPRMLTKQYGRRVIESLPPARLVTTIEEATAVFDEEATVAS